jgi:hypothetical protein
VEEVIDHELTTQQGEDHAPRCATLEDLATAVILTEYRRPAEVPYHSAFSSESDSTEGTEICSDAQESPVNRERETLFDQPRLGNLKGKLKRMNLQVKIPNNRLQATGTGMQSSFLCSH